MLALPLWVLGVSSFQPNIPQGPAPAPEAPAALEKLQPHRPGALPTTQTEQQLLGRLRSGYF